MTFSAMKISQSRSALLKDPTKALCISAPRLEGKWRNLTNLYGGKQRGCHYYFLCRECVGFTRLKYSLWDVGVIVFFLLNGGGVVIGVCSVNDRFVKSITLKIFIIYKKRTVT